MVFSISYEGSALRATVPAGLNRKEAEIFSRLDPERLPHHVAIIMDGNGRWARRRHLPRIAGHRAGVVAVRSTVETAARIGIPALELPQEVQERMSWARESTERNTGMVLTLALNYGARTEMVDCFNALAREASRNGGLDHLKVDEKAISRNLYTHGLPELDLLIRTSGEMRLSNFLLWQAAYAEIFVTNTLWPDFCGTELLEAIEAFQKRERRFGGLIGDGHPS